MRENQQVFSNVCVYVFYVCLFGGSKVRGKQRGFVCVRCDFLRWWEVNIDTRTPHNNNITAHNTDNSNISFGFNNKTPSSSN